jgi:hypothetical protein
MVLAFAVWLWPNNSSKRTLADGTVLILSGLKVGRTNTYSHGTLLSKTLGRFVPSKGVTVAGYTLRRPSQVTFTGTEGSEILSAQLRLLGASPGVNSLVSPSFYRKYRLLIQTNLGGFPVRIRFVNGDMLNVELMNKPSETRLTLVNAVDDEGNDLNNWSGSWGQHSFMRSLKGSKPGNVHATVGIHQNYPARFTLLPRFERAANLREPGSTKPGGSGR